MFENNNLWVFHYVGPLLTFDPMLKKTFISAALKFQ